MIASAEDNDIQWMQKALQLAQEAGSKDEVPVGAVLVVDNQVVGEGFNQPIISNDPTAHAEIVAIRSAAAELNNYRIPGSTLYVTLEPCSMCAGAIVHSRIERLVYGAKEPKAGVVCSQHKFFEQGYLNHQPEIKGGVLAEESSELLKSFFNEKRMAKRELKDKG